MPQPMIPTMAPPVVIVPQPIQHEYQWQYIDLKGICRGPFSQAAMCKWYMNGQLPVNLKIKLFGQDKDFYPLTVRWQAAQPNIPFSVPPPGGF